MFHAGSAQVRRLLSPSALLRRTGFRRRKRVTADDLRRLAVPTLLLWGEHDPVGSGHVARRLVTLILHASSGSSTRTTPPG